ncbi:hypothetical protein D3C72_2314490 [compost metagenome]
MLFLRRHCHSFRYHSDKADYRPRRRPLGFVVIPRIRKHAAIRSTTSVNVMNETARCYVASGLSVGEPNIKGEIENI